jgi:hypothetical protein
MLNFTKFLTEIFYKGVDARHGYTEVWKNPKDNEMIECAKRAMDNWSSDPDLKKKFGKNCYYLGALVTGKNVYVFNRDERQHADAMEIFLSKGTPSDLLTLYFYYYPYSNSLAIGTSGFSSPKQPPPAKTLMPMLRAIPWFKRFDNVFNYDEERFGRR